MDANPAAALKHALNPATAAAGDWRSTLARFGLTAKGVLYAAIGVLALQVAAGDTSPESADQRGAVELVASQPFGQWLLVLLTAGLFCLAIWQVIIAIKGDPVEGNGTADRVRYAVKAVIYFAVAGTALAILLAHWGTDVGSLPGSGDSNTQSDAAARMMSWPAGPWLVGAAGALIIGLAAYQFYKHTLNMEFMYRLDRWRMSGRLQAGVERAGRAGYGARSIVLAVAGLFLVIAAAQHDPQQAVGFSGAIREISQQTWGELVLWGVAIGVFLYGLFCFAEAKYRRAV